ncbi:MAG: DUF1343 domain-containing protein [Deltaproteobacteria bacterium]|nr:DUF1343 domain-containing protein [Deltaproteobacteria bacterium]
MIGIRLATALFAAIWGGVASAAPSEPVIPGVEVLLSDRIDLVQGMRVGLLTNPAAVDRKLVSTLDRLRGDSRVKLTQLWAPEHGLAAATPNGTSNIKGIEARTRLPIEGLFGDRTAPSAEALSRVDVLLFDLQDIGSRTYTYVSSLGKVMQACAAHKVKVVVLDRPNPLGGTLFEGPVRLPKYKSLLGWGPFPVTHGMTFGEIAKFYNEELQIKAQLEVVAMKGWRRSMVWDDTGLVWVPTSPGIPKPLNATMYVATGMVCGSGPNCNEGGGNAMPFELVGAPWLDGERLAAALTHRAKDVSGLQHVRFRPMTWLPWHGQYDGKVTHGVQIHLLDLHDFRPLRLALIILSVLHDEFPSQIKVSSAHRFGMIWGNDDVLRDLRAHKPWTHIEAAWQKDLDGFAQIRARYLMYPP